MPNVIHRILRRLTTTGVIEALYTLHWELGTMQKHHRGLRMAKKYAGAKGLKLHLGCGINVKQGWVNVDLNDQADITLDLRESLPFLDASCSTIYSEHFLEHIDYPSGANAFLKECYRILESGGIISVGVPDAEWPLLEYAGIKSEGYFEKAKALWHPKWCETEIEHINYHFRAGGHCFAYDFETLHHILSKNGYIEIKRRAFDPQLDQQARELGTLYVSAKKSCS